MFNPTRVGVAGTSSIPQEISIPSFRRKPQEAPAIVEDTDYTEEDEEGAYKQADNGSIWDANPSGNPTWWQMPAGMALGGAGLYGGWKGIDALLAAKRRGDVDSELADAEGEYNEALGEQYNAAMAAKGAASDTYDGLDELCDAMEKQAILGLENVRLGVDMPDVSSMIPSQAKDIAHGLGGAYTTAALAALLGGGYAGYNWAKGKSRESLLADALRRRAKTRSQPQPIYARPQDDVAEN